MSAAINQESGLPKIRSIKKKILLIPGWILSLAALSLGLIQSGNPSNLLDISGFLFVVVGGVALAMISFPGAEIWRALRDSAITPVNGVDLRASMFFWEAAGRGFWISGILGSILHLLIFYRSIGTVESGTWQLMTRGLSQSLVATLYGFLLAVICFIPGWKLTAKLRSRPLGQTEEQCPTSIEHSGWRFAAAFGYVLFFLLLIFCFLRIPAPAPLLMGLKPAFLMVVGGTIALMLFFRGTKSPSTLYTALAVMGIVGLLIGSIQMQGHVVGALGFLLSSCLTPLLGIVLVGAPLEDRAIRTERIASPSTFSRLAWYIFPLLALIFLVPMFFMLTIPGLG
jgi:hypothetical protein